MDEQTQRLIADLRTAAQETLRQHELLTSMLDGICKAANALDDAVQEAEQRKGQPFLLVTDHRNTSGAA